MKRFIDYLIESTEEKKYAFKIKIAGDLPDNCEDCMEAALEQFKVSRFTKGKSTPIQSKLLDFPSVQNAPMTVFETEVDYPATSAVVAELLCNATGISRDCIRVRTPLEESNWEIENENNVEEKSKQSLLTQDYEKSKKQELFGEKQLTGLLKDLMKQRKETEPEQYKGANDALLAKKLHKEKAESMPTAGPARSLFGGSKKD